VENLVVHGAAFDVPRGGGINPSHLWFWMTDSEGVIKYGSPASPIPIDALPGAHVSVSPGGSAVSFSFSVPVVVSREGSDKAGRDYQFVIIDADRAGNTGFAVTSAVVPHDMGHPVQPGNLPVVVGAAPGGGGDDQGSGGGASGNGHGKGHRHG
jgi:hypothetical protein